MATRTVKKPAPKLARAKTKKAATKRDLRIVVLQRGWVAVGDYSLKGDEVIIADASIVRRWGTTKGLGELAAKGPQPNTVLDPSGTLRVHPAGVVLTFDCEVSAWATK